MRHCIIKVLSLIVALITLFSIIVLPASAYVAPIINPCDNTTVEEDLCNMGYNTYDYPCDPSADFVQVIHFLEYGYSKTDSRYYSLYLYLYNPSGKVISPNGSTLQLCYTSGGKETQYIKYNLKVLSASTESGSENTLYKLELLGAGNIARNIDFSSRIYNLASVEILYAGESKAYTKTLNSSDGKNRCMWTYSGFQKGFGSSDDVSTLRYTVKELDTIPVELHDASWMSDTSNLGEDYRWEVKSYFFNIPQSYINKYGNPTISTDDTDGLVAVEGQYYKYGLNGLIVPDQETYDLFKPLSEIAGTLDGFTLSDRPGFAYNYDHHTSTDHSKPNGGQYFTQYSSDFAFNVKSGTKYYSGSENIHYKSFIGFTLTYLDLVSQGISPSISNSALKALWEASGKRILYDSSLMYTGQYTSNIGDLITFEVSVNDGDLGSAIKTYSERKEWGSLNWLHKLFNKDLYTDKDGYLNCMPLVQINPIDVSGAFKESVQGKALYLNYDSYTDLQKFYNENAGKNSIFLMRLGIDPYYEVDVTLLKSPSSFEELGTGYYYEKVIHKDVDIFAFTFQNTKGELQRVPVECDPVDNLGSVVEGNNKDDNNPNGYPDDPTPGEIVVDWAKDLANFLTSLKGIVILVGSAIGLGVLAILIIVFWKYLEPWFSRAGKLLGKLGRGLGAVFGFVGKAIFNAFKALWNIGFTVLFYFTGLDLRIKGGLDFSSGSTQSHDGYDRENQKLRLNEERRAEERHQAEMKFLERGGNKSPAKELHEKELNEKE